MVYVKVKREVNSGMKTNQDLAHIQQMRVAEVKKYNALCALSKRDSKIFPKITMIKTIKE